MSMKKVLVGVLTNVVALSAGLGTILAIFFVIAALIALPVMWTWDYVMPAMFGLPVITFWQALWGTVMCRFLFTDVGIKIKGK